MQLPLVLAGPIVRRVTPGRVWVWLATSELLEPPQLLLYERTALSQTRAVESTAEWYPVALGRRLWIYLLAAVPARPLTPGHTYEYDVQLKGGRPLFSADELAQITLRGARRPSFVLGAQDSAQLRAIYGSCRKLHGPNPDMMKGAEHLLNRATPGERPEYLFLGGDQIYADDVHPALLPFTRPLRDALFGPVPEHIPGLSPLALGSTIDRTPFLKPFFTSGHMAHHLLTLAEFATTYLLAWNSALWKLLAALPGAPEIDSKLLGGAHGARRARRVLANTICYMIFDDHEITDDWFLNQAWEDNAVGHEAAIRIIANGMAAYWAFQGWGNEPDAFDETYRDTVSGFAVGLGRGTDQAWAALRKTSWSFVAPTSPPALFLDTRTRREASPPGDDEVGFGFRRAALHPFSPGILAQNIQSAPDVLTAARNTSAPRLLGEPERARVAELIDTHARVGAPLIVVAPAPIFGFPPVEWIQSEIGKISASAADLESWSGNPRNILDAIELLSRSQPEPLIILSGDVHYGFEVVGRMLSSTLSVPFVQLCSSALKNSVEGNDKFFFDFLSRFGEQELSLAFWDLRAADQTDGPVTSVSADSHAGEVFYELYGDPVVVLNTEFVQRPDRTGGKQRIEERNNLGELRISRGAVSHRHWYADEAGEAVGRDLVTWETHDWPVADILGLLLEALGVKTTRN